VGRRPAGVLPGRVINRKDVTAVTPAGTSYSGCAGGLTIGANFHYYTSLDTATHNLHKVDNAGTDSSIGAHGSGLPNQWGMCNDAVNIYIAGATRLTKWTGAAFSSFSATANAGSLAFVNNALYSCDGSTLNTYDGAGTKTTIFTWKDATNTALPALNQAAKLVPFGGKLLIFFPYLYDGPELWIYDGIAPSRLATLPDSMIGFDCEVVDGIAFMSGMVYGSDTAGNNSGIPVVYYYANGNVGELWRDIQAGPSAPSVNGYRMPALGNLSGRLVWAVNPNAVSQSSGLIREYDLASGAISVIATVGRTGNPTASFSLPRITSTPTSILAAMDKGTTGGEKLIFWPGSGTASAYIISSLIDFDSNLTKTFRSIKVETQDAASGFDIYYGTDTLSTFTLLQASATSGTEYTLPANTQGRAISIKVILNGTILQRYYVRAAPLLTSFKVRTYNLDLTCTPNNPTLLQDGSTQPLTGHEQAVNLITAIASTTPISITDRFGTYTAVLEPGQCNILELHSDSGGGVPANSGQFVATIVAREV
jgi:hypothetical protein